jgi:hypothetical protein
LLKDRKEIATMTLRNDRIFAVLLASLCATALLPVSAVGQTVRDLGVQFQRFDKNNDGRISAEELGMPTVFPQADKNGDGFVTPDEFAAYMEQRQRGRRVRTGQRRAPLQAAAPDDLVVWRDVRYRETPGMEANLQSLDNRVQKLQQAAAFQKALQAAGARCRFVEAPEHDHGSLNRAIGEPGDKVTAAMEQFLTEIEPGMKAPARDQPAAASTAPKGAARSPLSGSELHDVVKQYAALGDHRTASEVDRQTADWLANLLRQAGLQVEFQDFEVPQFQLRAASLKVAGQNVECFPVWPPKATAKPVVAPLTLAGAASLPGKIALITENPRLRRDEAALFQRLISAGAAGAVILDGRGEGTIHAPNVPRMGGPFAVPVLYAAKDQGATLSSAAQRGDQVELFIDGEFEPRAKARNVVASLDRGPKRIVVSTPYSGWFRCGGERGSGLAVFVALAHWAAKRETECSYTFVANSAHELGYAGMTAFLENHAPDPKTVVCWLHLGANVALLPEARPADGARPSRLFTTNPAWEPLLTPLLRDVPWVRVSGGREPTGELALVVPKGYTALNLAGGGNRWMHSPQDRAETTGPDVLQPLALALVACMEAIEAHQP